MTQATSNSKDNSNNMIAHNSRNTSYSRNESNSRTANTVLMPLTVGMLAKVMKPTTARREDNNNIDTNNMRSQQHSAGTPATAVETHN